MVYYLHTFDPVTTDRFPIDGVVVSQLTTFGIPLLQVLFLSHAFSPTKPYPCHASY